MITLFDVAYNWRGFSEPGHDALIIDTWNANGRIPTRLILREGGESDWDRWWFRTCIRDVPFPLIFRESVAADCSVKEGVIGRLFQPGLEAQTTTVNGYLEWWMLPWPAINLSQSPMQMVNRVYDYEPPEKQ